MQPRSTGRFYIIVFLARRRTVNYDSETRRIRTYAIHRRYGRSTVDRILCAFAESPRYLPDATQQTILFNAVVVKILLFRYVIDGAHLYDARRPRIVAATAAAAGRKFPPGLLCG